MIARLGFLDDNPKCCKALLQLRGLHTACKERKLVGKYFTLYIPTVEIGPLSQSQEFLLDEKCGKVAQNH